MGDAIHRREVSTDDHPRTVRGGRDGPALGVERMIERHRLAGPDVEGEDVEGIAFAGPAGGTPGGRALVNSPVA